MKSLYAFLRNIVAPTDAVPGEPQIQLGPEIPDAVRDAVHTDVGSKWTVYAVIMYKRTDTLYWYDALCTPDSPTAFGSMLVARGSIDGTLASVGQVWSYSGSIGGNRHRIGASQFDMDIAIGGSPDTSTGIKIAKSPLSVSGEMHIGNADGSVEISALTGVDIDTVVDAQLGYRAGGVDIGRGIVASRVFTSDSASITAEAEIAAVPDVPEETGRVFRVEVWGRFEGTTAGAMARWRLRKTNASGAQMVDFGSRPVLSTATVDASSCVWAYYKRVGATTTQDVSLTLESLGGGSVKMLGTSNVPWGITITDVGSTADWPSGIPDQ